MSKYILEEFGKDKGYKIEEQELYKIIDTEITRSEKKKTLAIMIM